ncbi:MAG: hypothetical protein NC402_04515 [Prevotella sp.]|nr:hypothetical protein [Prevotella sp.]MCM1075052.1 hypothetical protein [Ruminococcus sp.]
MSRTLTKWLILIALLAYAVIVSEWASSAVQKRNCTGVEIDIRPASPGVPDFLKPQAVLSEMGDIPAKFASTPLYAIDTDSLERHLNGVNNFEHVEVVRTSQGKLLVSVTPIVPEARVFTPAGSYYINKDGKRMDAGAEYFVDLPIVKGHFTNKMPASGALPVVRYIKNDPLLSQLITMIDYRSPANIMLVPRIRGHIINLGDTSDMPAKFEKLLLMYRKVMPYKGWNTYDTISLKFKGQIVATRADKTIARHSNINPDDVEDFEDEAAINETKPTEGPETEEIQPSPSPQQ